MRRRPAPPPRPPTCKVVGKVEAGRRLAVVPMVAASQEREERSRVPAGRLPHSSGWPTPPPCHLPAESWAGWRRRDEALWCSQTSRQDDAQIGGQVGLHGGLRPTSRPGEIVGRVGRQVLRACVGATRRADDCRPASGSRPESFAARESAASSAARSAPRYGLSAKSTMSGRRSRRRSVSPATRRWVAREMTPLARTATPMRSESERGDLERSRVPARLRKGSPTQALRAGEADGGAR